MNSTFKDTILKHLNYLSEIYENLGGQSISVAICGGAALNILDLIHRTTQDVDLISPEELPKEFVQAAKLTSQYFGLKPDWINQGPIDLLRMGLPKGYFKRCKTILEGGNVTWFITSRFDQIHFKLYASIDRGGYHVQDLHQLKPNTEELVCAAQWCLTHDVSNPFKSLLIDFLIKQGWQDAAQRIPK